MDYYIDCEFLEGKQKESFPISLFRKKTPNTIDLISIGIVEEDTDAFSKRIGKTDKTYRGREYYAISKDFNLKEAWNRYQIEKDFGKPQGLGDKKVYWIRDNVLKPIFLELCERDSIFATGEKDYFTFKRFKRLLNKYGKTNKQIAEEIKEFCKHGVLGIDEFAPNTLWPGGQLITRDKPEFYAYYADYDWVVFCWLFGKMIDLPRGFPMLAFDIQQLIYDNNIDKNELLKDVPQLNCHNSLEDALWNKNAHEWINKKINEKKRKGNYRTHGKGIIEQIEKVESYNKLSKEQELKLKKKQ